MQRWTILDAAGAVVDPCVKTASATSRPEAEGYPLKTGWKAVAIAADPDAAVHAWTGSSWAEDAARVQAVLIAAVKAESERRRMLIYTPSRGKMKEYQAKKQEVLDFRALTQTAGVATAVLNAALSVFNVSLDAPTRQRKFPFAMAEAALRGETVAQTIARYEAGMAASDGLVATLAAVEQKAVSDIRAAATAAAKRAAFAASTWPD